MSTIRFTSGRSSFSNAISFGVVIEYPGTACPSARKHVMLPEHSRGDTAACATLLRSVCDWIDEHLEPKPAGPPADVALPTEPGPEATSGN